MSASGLKAAILISGCAAAAAVAVYCAPGTSPVQENSLRLETAGLRAPATSVAPPALPAPSVALSYLQMLPEPSGASSAVQKTVVSAQLPQTPAVAAAEPLPPKVIAGGGCAAGSRPMGDCDCYNETLGKIARRLVPTKACIDEESKRLGHKVFVAAGDGKFELVGVAPPEPVNRYVPDTFGPSKRPSYQFSANQPRFQNFTAPFQAAQQKANCAPGTHSVIEFAGINEIKEVNLIQPVDLKVQAQQMREAQDRMNRQAASFTSPPPFFPAVANNTPPPPAPPPPPVQFVDLGPSKGCNCKR